MSSEISDMSLWMLEVPPGGSPLRLKIEHNERTLRVVHVTNAALPGPNNASGPHCVTIKKEDKKSKDITLCTLNKDTHPQHNLDFIIDETVEFKNFGKGPVHLVGYETYSYEPDSADEDQVPTSSDSEEAPEGVPLLQQAGRAASGPKAGKSTENGPVAMEEGDEDEDDSGDGFPELGSDDYVGECEDDEDFEGEEGSSEGSEGSDEGVEGSEESGEEGSEGEEEEEEEEEEMGSEEGSSGEEGEQQQQQQPKVGSKRPAPSPVALAAGKQQQQQQKQKQQQQQQPMTPAPKKAKQQEASKQAPNSAPAKQQQSKQQQEGKQTPSKAAPANEQEFQAALVDFLRSQPNKTAPLAKIGTAVHRPAGVPKLANWIKSKPDMFRLDANNQNLTLK